MTRKVFILYEKHTRIHYKMEKQLDPQQTVITKNIARLVVLVVGLLICVFMGH